MANEHLHIQQQCSFLHMHAQSSLWDGAAEKCWVCLGREAEKSAQSVTCLVAEQEQGVNTAELQCICALFYP